jgi:hypothetical protein
MTGREVDDMSDWETPEASEMGATVIPGPPQYRFHCASCDVYGQTYDNADQAQSEGLAHEHSMHPRVYTIQQLGG